MNNQTPGSVIGGILLVAGCCIGAGMLALPILTGLAGFFPSLLALFASWAFMTFTGLLLVEICGWSYGSTDILTLAKESLGEGGRIVAWLTYVFLFYALLVAYTAASGGIFAAILSELFGWHLAPWAASVFFTALFGLIVYLGTRPVDLVNRMLMFGLILAYLGMIGLGIFHIKPTLFSHMAPKAIFLPLPILVISFGFQNMIPTLTTYLRGDLKRVRITVLGGSVLALVVYLLWSLFVLGTVQLEGPHGIVESYKQGKEATEALRYALNNPKIIGFAQGFAFFAIVTSFLAQAMSLTHFLADGFRKKNEEETYFQRAHMGLLCLGALLPPLAFALWAPQVFYKALSFAGGICAMILFGILPISMAWIGRYFKNKTSNYHVCGGKVTLTIGFAFSLFVIVIELYHLFF